MSKWRSLNVMRRLKVSAWLFSDSVVTIRFVGFLTRWVFLDLDFTNSYICGPYLRCVDFHYNQFNSIQLKGRT